MAKRKPAKATDAKLLAALKACHGNCLAAAKRLRMPAISLYARLRDLPEVPEIVLWHRLRNSKRLRREAWEELMRRHVPMVKRIAARLKSRLPKHIALDDLVAAGLGGSATRDTSTGLHRAIETYRHNGKTAFPTFAYQHIRGAMLDYVREVDHESRRTRQLESRRHEIELNLAHELARRPTDEEVAAALGWTPKQLQASKPKYGHPLERYERGPDLKPVYEPPAKEDGELSHQRTCAAIASATRGLPFDWRIVIYLHFAKRKTLDACGEALDISESRCSQIKTDAIKWLRAHRTRDELLEVLF